MKLFAKLIDKLTMPGISMGKVKTSAPGKCILFGEHAVVYGQPAIAIAIEQRMNIEISDDSEESFWRIDGKEFDGKKHPHVQALKDRLWPDSLGAPPLSIKIQGDIPAASGLGSSAALSVAACAALRAARGRWIKKYGEVSNPDDWAEGFHTLISDTDAYAVCDQVRDAGRRKGSEGLGDFHVVNEESVDVEECSIIGHSIEAVAQGGRASPLDATTCSYGRVILLSDKLEPGVDWIGTRKLESPDGTFSWEIHSLDVRTSEDIYIVIGHTEEYSSTASQVQYVSDLLKENPERMQEIEAIGHVTRRGVDALIKGDFVAVGHAMKENQLLLSMLGVSSKKLDDLIDAANPSSLGAKLTGAGGGGCMIALTRNPKETSEAIELAGGKTYISRFSNAGLSVDAVDNLPLWNLPGK